MIHKKLPFSLGQARGTLPWSCSCRVPAVTEVMPLSPSLLRPKARQPSPRRTDPMRWSEHSISPKLERCPLRYGPVCQTPFLSMLTLRGGLANGSPSNLAPCKYGLSQTLGQQRGRRKKICHLSPHAGVASLSSDTDGPTSIPLQTHRHGKTEQSERTC